jgi:hypothetical protein
MGRLAVSTAYALASLCMAACVTALAGCGTTTEAGAGPAARQQPNAPVADRRRVAEANAAVARVVATGILKNRENVDRAPTEQEIRAFLRRGVATACTPRAGQLFACKIRVPASPAFGCMARVKRVRVVGNLRCGAEPPAVTDEFVDCKQIGRARTITDPSGDTLSFRRGRSRPHPIARPEGDLTEITIARNDHELCAMFSFAGPPSRRTAIVLFAGRAEPTRPPADALDATIHLNALGGPEVTDLDHGSLSARVGLKGNRVSLVVDARALTPALRYLVTDEFQFRAEARYVPAVAVRGAQDVAPNAIPLSKYP